MTLPPEMRAAVDRVLADAPPLTPEVVERLRLIIQAPQARAS